ncbi:hypothetical protein AA16663_1355 [Komagataeibacter rhaeticus DSM 16663]|nr:hypothetical protein AA16663_1355 [Komagataeibacter rhaeticus DSM 16663]
MARAHTFSNTRLNGYAAAGHGRHPVRTLAMARAFADMSGVAGQMPDGPTAGNRKGGGRRDADKSGRHGIGHTGRTDPAGGNARTAA